MWVSELMETAGSLQEEPQGGCSLGTGHRGVIVGNPLRSGSGRLSLTRCCPGARVGGRRGHTGPCDTCQPLGKPLSLSCYCLVLPSQFVKGNSVSVFPGRETEALGEAM